MNKRVNGETEAGRREAIRSELARALAAFQGGDSDGAERHARAALAMEPGNSDALHTLGVLACRRGQRSEGAALLRRSLQGAPGNANAHFNLGVVLIEMGEYAAAAESHRLAIAHNPAYAEAWSSLSAALGHLGDAEQAIIAARRAVQLSPALVGATANLAVALRVQGDELGAMQAILECVQQNPESGEAWFNMAAALQASGEPAGAIRAYERAIALDPGHVVARAQCALARLLIGDFARGWPEYEWRLRLPGKEIREFPRPRWRGEELAGRTILVHTEQGLGDAIQMLRYVRPLAARAERVILQADRAVLPLVPRLANVTPIVDGVSPVFDVECPSLTLPLCFGTTLDNIPGGKAYLEADSDRVGAWGTRIRGGGGGTERRVGLVWSGNPAFGNDRNRSVRFATLAPMLGVPGVRWFSLHVRPLEAAACDAGVIDMSSDLTDLGETAAAIMCLDLVITVDTSVAHLAGALGTPVWILLPFVPDWRWLLGRNDSPWYPSARLFRQRSIGDWDSVVADVAAALRSGAEEGLDQGHPLR